MSIYSRDNIAYQSMIDNMINNRMKTLASQNEREQKYADIASDTAKGLASTFARGMDYVQSANERAELENKLDELTKKKEALIREYSKQEQDYYNPTNYNYQQRNNTTVNPNRSYNDTAYVNANPDNYYEFLGNPQDYGIQFSKKEQWLMDHPGKTEEDYEAYITYLNGVYGGR